MSSPQQRTTLQCPNCGGTMTFNFVGDLNDKQVICQYCQTAFDVPDNFERVRKVRREQKGFLRKREVVEEEIHERRSDFAPPPPPQPQFQQQAGQPIVINVPGFNLTPGMQAAQQVTTGASCIGTLIVLFFVGCTAVSILGAVLFSTNVIDELPFGLDELAAEFGVVNVEERQAMRAIGGHESLIEQVLYSVDGTRFITIDLMNTLRLWDAETYALIQEYNDSMTSGTEVKFIGDGGSFVAVNAQGHIVEWNAATGERVRSNTSGNIYTAIFRDDGLQYAAVTYNNYGLSIHDYPSGNRIATSEIGEWIQGGQYSPTGDYLVLMGGVGELYVWETTTWRLIYQDESIATNANALAFIPNTDKFVVANSEQIDTYEIRNSTVSRPETWNVKSDFNSSDLLSIESLAFSPDGKYLATGNFFDGVYVWDFEDHKLLVELVTESAPRTVDFSGDGTRLIAGSTFNGDVFIWDVTGIDD